MAVEARESSTVVLIRDRAADARPEILLMRRHARANFGAGAYVFPGGILEPQDFSPDVLSLASGMSVTEAAQEMPGLTPPERALGLRIAAFRETFEEAGVLLAMREDHSWFHPTPQEAPLLHSARSDSDYYGLVRRMGLRLPMDELVYIGHWITPECRPVRFDTRFFLLAVTERLEVLPDRQEVFDELWVTPQEALDMEQRGELKLMNPTVINLEWLAKYTSTTQAVAELRGKTVETIRPKIIMTPQGKERIVHPWDEEYTSL